MTSQVSRGLFRPINSRTWLRKQLTNPIDIAEAWLALFSPSQQTNLFGWGPLRQPVLWSSKVCGSRLDTARASPSVAPSWLQHASQSIHRRLWCPFQLTRLCVRSWWTESVASRPHLRRWSPSSLDMLAQLSGTSDPQMWGQIEKNLKEHICILEKIRLHLLFVLVPSLKLELRTENCSSTYIPSTYQHLNTDLVIKLPDLCL